MGDKLTLNLIKIIIKTSKDFIFKNLSQMDLRVLDLTNSNLIGATCRYK